jgi:hypothetical protein
MTSKSIILILLILLLLPFSLSNPNSICNSLFSIHIQDKTDLKILLKKYIDEIINEETNCFDLLLSKAKYSEVEYLIQELNMRNIKYNNKLKESINKISQRLKEIYNKFRFDENEYILGSPAFQWAQNIENVFIEIKYAHRFDSPGCLEVKKENLTFNLNQISFSAYCIQGDTPINFLLDLQLFDDIINEESSSVSASVGRLQLTLKKKEPRFWNSLLKPGTDSPSNMRMWLEMREKYISEIQKYLDEKEEEENKGVDSEIEMMKKKKEKEKKRDDEDL